MPASQSRRWSEEIRRTAYHEAGHVILYVLMGIPFKSAEVFSQSHPAPPELDGDYAGIVYDWAYDYWPCWAVSHCPGFRTHRALRYWDRVMCVSWAGEAAESQYVGHGVPGWVSAIDKRVLRDLR